MSPADLTPGSWPSSSQFFPCQLHNHGGFLCQHSSGSQARLEAEWAEASVSPMSICCPHRHCCVHRDGQHLRLCQLHPPGAGVLEGESSEAVREIDFLCHSSADCRSDKGLSRPRSQRPIRWKEGENLQPALSSDIHTHTLWRMHACSYEHMHIFLSHTYN